MPVRGGGPVFPVRYAAFVAAGFVLWALVSGWIAPALIQAGYRGESTAIVNDVFDGRDVHPVEFYLDQWRSLSLAVTSAILLLLPVAYLGFRFAEPRRRTIAWIVGGQAGLGPGRLIWYGLSLGFLSGLVEATASLVRQVVAHRPGSGFHSDELWMTPLSASLAAAGVAISLAALARLGGTRISVWKATWLFGFFVIHAVVGSPGIPLYPAAEVLLSVGLATVVARAVAARAHGLSRAIHFARPALIGGVGILAAFAVLNRPALVEHRALAAHPPGAADRPNVLLVVLDTVRAANLSLYGYERETSPRLASWAQSGVVFEHAYATAPWTLPTHATLFTGRYHFETRTGSYAALDETYPTLAEVLSDAGYATAAFVANLNYTTPASGLGRGFARYQSHLINSVAFIQSSWLSRTIVRPFTRMTGWLVPRAKNGSDVTAEFVGWLDERRNDRPFLAFLNYFDAHAPYAPQEPFASAFGPGPDAEWETFDGQWDETRGTDAAGQQLQRWVNRYDAAIAYVDHQFGLIRDALAARGLLDNTILIVTSDHGEMWGDHGLIKHSNSLYQPLLRVPLIVSFPAEISGGLRVNEPVTLRDLPATTLALVGLSDGARLPGESLGPLLRAGGVIQRVSPVLAEVDLMDFNRHPGAPILRGDMNSLFEGGFHYILAGDGGEELYDLRLDPGESTNLVSDPELVEVVERLRLRLLSTGAVGRE